MLIHLNTTGFTGVGIRYLLRDIDGSADNSVQPVALQYRVGSSGAFVNVPAGFVADASSGPSLATLVTTVSATLPAAADNQALVQVRIITANAAGADEWIGIDNITVAGSAIGPSCGNGMVEAGEACDTGALNGTTPCGCTTMCAFVASGTTCGAPLPLASISAVRRCTGSRRKSGSPFIGIQPSP